jgi:hypothetical protein
MVHPAWSDRHGNEITAAWHHGRDCHRREIALPPPRRSTLLATGLFLSATAHADVFDHPATGADLLAGPLAQAAAQLAGAQAIRGRFVFERYLPDVPKPLQSSGEYVVLKGIGIDWHTLAPFDSEVIVAANGVTQIDDGTARRLGNADQGAMHGAIRMLSALLTLDVDALAATFDLFGDVADGRWSVGLKPRAQDVATVVRDATISGSAQVETVELHDPNGDRTVIEFHDVTYDAAATAADRARFER